MDILMVRNAAADAGDWRLVAATLAGENYGWPRIVVRELFVIAASRGALCPIDIRKVRTCLKAAEVSDAKGR